MYAGVLPVVVDNAGEKWALVGREACGNDKDRWSDFGGGVEPWDKGRLEATALREGREESAGILAPWLKKSNLGVSYAASDASKSRVFVLHLPTSITTSRRWRQNWNDEFRTARSTAESPFEREKSEVRWVPFKALKHVAEHFPELLRSCFAKTVRGMRLSAITAI